ncbi:MAG TPA: CocE/NonD family hydrolase [Terracidiphilus sp.]|nr:CocE/NonD family hydrolase [Terracidiphilus sp.]
MFRKVIYLLVLVVLGLPASLFGQSAAPQLLSDMVFERGVEMKTRDGVTLRADVYRPGGEGPFPVLLQRTPYNKDNGADFARHAVAHGFMVVVQDVRGRYTSDGEWYTFKHETDDGYDTVEWAAALPHSSGKVGMWGGSYVGATQMLAAIGHPPHLAGICPVVTASNYHENWTYQGGAFEQWFNESWGSGLAQDTLDHSIHDHSNALAADTVLPLTQFPMFNIQPIANGTQLTHELSPYFLDWLAHPTYDSYWRQWSIAENYDKIQVPALTIAAWYDIFQGGSLKNYVGMRDHAGSEAARGQQRLIVILGGHAGFGRKIGDVDFGADAPFDENTVTLDWYDYLFLGKQNQFADAAHPVRLFVMGKNEWRNEAAWPLTRARQTIYYLHSAGKANSSAGDGVLAAAKPAKDAADTFTYDPANPVPTVGGPLCCDPTHLPAGPRDQKDVETRADVLVYSTPALEQDLEVTGPVTLNLFAKSSAVDTDFTAKLVDVWPNGFVQNLTEGILRASFRESTLGDPKPIAPGQAYEYKIDLWSTSNVFLKGHKIRLEVSSSNFPRFDRNLNNGKRAADSSDFVKATNTILHDSEHPSALLLPVVAQ